jgi:hypothetical protein
VLSMLAQQKKPANLNRSIIIADPAALDGIV